ncbi:MAG: ATP-dependent zinc metalloprotease FtsH [Geminicoccaceae bacterium]|nr:ATP-dependent zinc metalloprotease FtsH [Geminicoccaceae bacterium]
MQINFAYFILAFFIILIFQNWWIASQSTEQVPYSHFEQLLAEGKVAEVRVGDQFIQGKYTSPSDGGFEYFRTVRVQPEIAGLLGKYNVKFAGVVESTWLRDLLSWIVPVLLFLGLWMFLIRRLAKSQGGIGGLMQVGRSKAKVYVERDTRTGFADVAGVDEAKAELVEIVDFLKEPKTYGRLGARIPKGVLLVGPPGTGKTLLARAVAGEAGVPFFSISGSEFVEMFVGVGAARVRDLFEQARKSAPCIIFIDELDALGRARSAGGMMGGHDEKEQTLNQLLTELDGFDTAEGIVLLGATNRPEILDPALLRAGRFDRQVLVDRPDRQGRLQILEVHIRKIQALAPDVKLEQIAALTPGFTGADLANLVNEAALLATRRRGESVTMEDFNNAIERIIAGLEKRSRLLHPHERKVVAYHEMGHALVAANLPSTDPVHKISIIPRGIGALGYTIQRPEEDRFLMTTQELKDKMAVLMGGRAAEDLTFGEISTGAADDLDKITNIARHMVMRYGMEEATSQVVYDPQRQSHLGEGALMPRPREFSEETAREIDVAIRRLVDEAFKSARDLLEARRDLLERGAELLLARETITADDFPPLKRAVRRRWADAEDKREALEAPAAG